MTEAQAAAAPLVAMGAPRRLNGPVTGLGAIGGTRIGQALDLNVARGETESDKRGLWMDRLGK